MINHREEAISDMMGNTAEGYMAYLFTVDADTLRYHHAKWTKSDNMSLRCLKYLVSDVADMRSISLK